MLSPTCTQVVALNGAVSLYPLSVFLRDIY